MRGLTSRSPTCSNCGRSLPADGGPCPACTIASPEAAAPPAATPGMVAGRYLLQRQLGRGASKDVWLAHDLTLDRGVALARVSGPEAWERLRREARLTARLGGHRHIVTVHDVFDDAGTPCLVARYMTGGSLTDRLDRAPAGRMEPQEVIAAGREIADALAHAHAHGVVHRDVKPDNVWIDAEGEAALGDFGVAVTEGENAPPAGTPRYAAPEQSIGEPATPRSDLFALGVTLYELLCGVRPFETKDIFRMHRPAPPSSLVPGIPEELDRLILELVEPDPENRPANAAVVSAALARLVTRAPEEPFAPAGLVGRAPELERLRKALDAGVDGRRAHGRSWPASRGSARRRCSTRWRPRPGAAAASRSGAAASPRAGPTASGARSCAA